MILCVGAATLWIWGKHQKVGLQFRTRYGLSEVTSRDGRFWFDNEPQRAMEYEALGARLGTQANHEFALAQDAYAQSGRDLEDHLTPEQQAAREQFHAHVQAAAEIQQEFVRQNSQLRQQWTQKPPIRWSIRCGLVTAMAMLFPAGFLWRALVRRRASLRRKNNRCARCGYDLRATPQRCPECGTAAAVAAGGGGL
jgi:hypothetical protein